MSRIIKCSGCLQELEHARNKLANRRAWEVKAKEVERSNIAYWEEKVNSPPPPLDPHVLYYCFCYSAGQPNAEAYGGREYYCDKCGKSSWLEINQYGDEEPISNHVCRENECRNCGNAFIGIECSKCEDIKKKKEKERDKRDLEQKINGYQQVLKAHKSMRNHPSYSEYQVQTFERLLAEAVSEYREKYGELPLSLRDGGRGGGGVKFTQQWIPQRWKRKELCSINSASGNCSSSDCF